MDFAERVLQAVVTEVGRPISHERLDELCSQALQHAILLESVTPEALPRMCSVQLQFPSSTLWWKVLEIIQTILGAFWILFPRLRMRLRFLRLYFNPMNRPRVHEIRKWSTWQKKCRIWCSIVIGSRDDCCSRNDMLDIIVVDRVGPVWFRKKIVSLKMQH